MECKEPKLASRITSHVCSLYSVNHDISVSQINCPTTAQTRSKKNKKTSITIPSEGISAGELHLMSNVLQKFQRHLEAVSNLGERLSHLGILQPGDTHSIISSFPQVQSQTTGQLNLSFKTIAKPLNFYLRGLKPVKQVSYLHIFPRSVRNYKTPSMQ